MHAVKRNAGQSLVEVTIGIALLATVTLILLDLSFLLWGVQTNDQTCRSAAREAASGDPRSATARAQTVVDRTDMRVKGPIVSNSLLVTPVEVNITGQPEPQIDSTTGKEVNPGGPVTGTVSVQTEIEVRPFVLESFFTKDRVLKFRAQQTCPITYIMPASPAPSNKQKDDSLYPSSQ